MFDFGSIKEIFLILGGVIVFLFVFYIVLVITSDTKKKGTTTPQITSNKCNDDKDCEGNKLCSNEGECVCPPWFTGINCDEPIISNNSLQNFMNILQEPDVTEEKITDVYNNLKQIVPGNYKNKNDMLKVISNLKFLIDPTISKDEKQKYISDINNIIIQKECQLPKVLCHDNCVDLGTNLNCSKCDDKCLDGKYCVNNKCEDCPANKNKCTNPDGTLICTDFNTDSLNCGSCGNICQNGTICSSGNCICPENSVLFDGKCINNDNSQYKTCGNTLIDSFSNEDHCGTCDNKCKDTEKCDNGLCVCKEGYGKCDDTGLCIPLNTKDHCGTCENKCHNTQECANGNCVCPMNSVWYSADGQNYSCVVNDGRYKEFGDGVYYDTLTSKERCGAEGKKCRDDQKCDNGNCVCEDPVTTECNDKCVNYNTDSRNCGDCNKFVPGNLACNDGKPVDSHTPSGVFRYCGDWTGDWQNGKVLNISTDSNNCGECGFSCSGGQECKDGKCVCPIGSVWYNSNCEDNKDGRYISCGVDKDNNNIYYDKLNDKEHCGNCTTKCRDDQICVGGLCVCSDSSKTDCDGKCVDTKTDKNNCNKCKNICPDKQECVDGNCVCPAGTVWYRAPDTLNGGYTCIDNSTGRYKQFDGIYYDTLTSSERCGANGDKCKTDQYCSDGNCVCRDSTKTVCNGECININGNDINNCGKCGQKCNSANNEKCDRGICTCSDGYTDCNGACIDVNANDSNNCGACDKKCTNGMICKPKFIETTNPQYRIRPGSTIIKQPGTNIAGVYVGTCMCETGKFGDNNNCGTCGNKCRADQICSGGKCVCPEGLTECNGKCVNTKTDVKFCGSCTNMCVDTQGCVNGVCQCPTGQNLCKGKCVDFKTDNLNCGFCGVAVPANTKCTEGKPVGIDPFAYCPNSPWPSLDYKVPNIKNDESNCGSCGNKLDTKLLCCDGKSTEISNNNCGECGIICDSSKNKACDGVKCSCLPGYTQRDENCIVESACQQLQTITVTRNGSCAVNYNPLDCNLNNLDGSYNNYWYIFVVALPGVRISNFVFNSGQDYTDYYSQNDYANLRINGYKRDKDFLYNQILKLNNAGGTFKVFTTSGGAGANTINVNITFQLQTYNGFGDYCTVNLVYRKSDGYFAPPTVTSGSSNNMVYYPYGRDAATLAKYGSDCCLTPATFVIGRPFP